MTFLIVAGGTGGHIFPALAVAEELRGRGARLERCGMKYVIEFLGTQRPLEARLIPAAGFPLRTVRAAGLKGMGGLRGFRNLMLLPRTAVATAGILRDVQPQVVIGVGGYLAGPVMLEAALHDIPTLLIEPMRSRVSPTAPWRRWSAWRQLASHRLPGAMARRLALPAIRFGRRFMPSHPKGTRRR